MLNNRTMGFLKFLFFCGFLPEKKVRIGSSEPRLINIPLLWEVQKPEPKGATIVGMKRKKKRVYDDEAVPPDDRRWPDYIAVVSDEVDPPPPGLTTTNYMTLGAPR